MYSEYIAFPDHN